MKNQKIKSKILLSSQISVDDKIKKWNYANIRNENMSDGDRETKKRMYARLLLLLNC